MPGSFKHTDSSAELCSTQSPHFREMWCPAKSRAVNSLSYSTDNQNDRIDDLKEYESFQGSGQLKLELPTRFPGEFEGLPEKNWDRRSTIMGK